MVKEAIEYSNNWIIRKRSPRPMVKERRRDEIK